MAFRSLQPAYWQRIKGHALRRRKTIDRASCITLGAFVLFNKWMYAKWPNSSCLLEAWYSMKFYVESTLSIDCSFFFLINFCCQREQLLHVSRDRSFKMGDVKLSPTITMTAYSTMWLHTLTPVHAMSECCGHVHFDYKIDQWMNRTPPARSWLFKFSCLVFSAFT